MRTVESSISPKTLENIQGKTLVNVLVEEQPSGAFTYQQIAASGSATPQEVLAEVQRAFSSYMEVKERESARATRAILLNQSTPDDLLKLEEVDNYCRALRAELARLTPLILSA